MDDKIQEEKLLETTIDMLITRVQDLKNSLTTFIFKLEHENPSWPQMLDSFAVLSGQINTLNKIMKDERMPIFRNLVLFPILVSLDRDESLEKATEGRIQAFSHEVVPDALRTKYEPDVEKEETKFEKKAIELSEEEARHQINELNELASTMIDIITTAREDWESENTTKDTPTVPSVGDTNILLNAILNGTALRKRQSSASLDSDQRSSHGKASSTAKAGLRAHPYAGHLSQRTSQK
eukprot:gene7851-8700_t